MYMLDTNICIYLINNKHPELAHKIIDIPRDKICISSVTLAELEYGVAKSERIKENAQSLKQFISVINVVNFDGLAAEEYGGIRAALESKGKTIGPLDMLIASHARSRRDAIITNNTKEFAKVDGLLVEDWTR